MVVFLETTRLLLRRFTAADVDNLVALDSDPEVMRFLSGGKPTPRAVIEHETLPRFLHYYQPFTRFGYWAAIEKSSGDFLGWFHFRSPEGGYGRSDRNAGTESLLGAREWCRWICYRHDGGVGRGWLLTRPSSH